MSKKLFKFLSLILFAAMIMMTVAGCQKREQMTAAKTTEFVFEVVDGDGNVRTYDIKTDRATVGAALLEEGLIEGDEGDYGLYVKKVTGIEAVFEETGTFWAFYINGEYAMTGVDTTVPESGATYSFRVETA